MNSESQVEESEAPIARIGVSKSVGRIRNELQCSSKEEKTRMMVSDDSTGRTF